MRRAQLVLGENLALLLMGLLTGTACALIAVIPARQALHVAGLTVVLAIVVLTGLGVLALSAWFGGRRITPSDLRGE
jgi:hypothetical protein